MSDPHSTHDDGPHEGPIKTPKQVILAVIFGFIVPIMVIVLLVTQVTANNRPAAGSDGLAEEATARRIQPVGTVLIKDPSDVAAMKTGEQVYNAQCVACHGSGAAGAPKFGDRAAWAPRITQGYETLLNSALKGKNAMGAQGGGDYSPLEIGRAVVYMANKGGAKFAEPAVAAAPGAASASTATGTETTTSTAAVPALYTQVCAACHAAGVAGAPKLGDKAAWSSRLAAGVDGLTASAIKGKNAMPAKGGSQASDDEIKAVVTYMVNAVK